MMIYTYNDIDPFFFSVVFSVAAADTFIPDIVYSTPWPMEKDEPNMYESVQEMETSSPGRPDTTPSDFMEPPYVEVREGGDEEEDLGESTTKLYDDLTENIREVSAGVPMADFEAYNEDHDHEENLNHFSVSYRALGGSDSELAELAASLPGGGVPGEDFPVLSEVPDTGFQCADQAVSGYYADDADEAGCQVFHICQLRESGRVQQDSFLCPNGTIFNQQYLVCDWWFNFDCSTAQDFYSVNEAIEVVDEDGLGEYGQVITDGDVYGAPAQDKTNINEGYLEEFHEEYQ